ncbi:ATPase family AAA domain-containing protein 3B [Colletotrichum sidae]|uniref:ATPase family AAA domain-containing protein 3B n=1 Tax=Colletotrichum sidae TaxID=1347389 RepID=A0A4R8TN93_9PEZI|nr:ATPase family AAA domain-containing protein 3B [Colletotrichum sidae]
MASHENEADAREAPEEQDVAPEAEENAYESESDDDSDSSRSASSKGSNESGGLYISSTISRNGIISKKSERRDLLSNLNVRFDTAESDGSDESDDSDDSDDNEVSPCTPSFGTLHEISCTIDRHFHDKALSVDPPVTKKASSAGHQIDARNKVPSLGFYMKRHPEHCFIVIKEHECTPMVFYDGSKISRISARSERLVVVSPLLQRALKEVASYRFHADRELLAPYNFLFHHLSGIDALMDDKTYGPVLQPLRTFLDASYGEEFAEANTMFSDGFVNLRHLEKLFRPNQMVVQKRADTNEARIITRHQLTPSADRLSFMGWTFVYNGTDLKRNDWFGWMKPMGEGKMKISDLPIHPIEHAREEELEKLKTRGQKFWDMREQIYTCYTGWDCRHDYQYVAARFMVDVSTYQLMHPSGRSEATYSSVHDEDPKHDKWPSKINKRERLPQGAEVLMPSTIYGFDLEKKKWVELEVENFHPIAWNKKAFERLVLDQQTKEMIRALIDVQATATKMDDIITGKGNGLIVLLHGSPGTGKTLTAETVAEIAEKPLYRVTCGDIGTEAQDVERYLTSVMYLGKVWDCVLLLDEADVFLEERTMADLQRNSLVSVFLRVLEYYEGILILTSNRVGTFDEAFKSRIQVAIHYDDLTKKSRKTIWQNFFDMMDESPHEDANIKELEREIDQLATEDMNGRQIRNALLTARQLAKHRKEQLDWSHLNQVMKTSATFNKYLKKVRGHSDEQWAREERLR